MKTYDLAYLTSTSDVAEDGLRFGWIGEDGEQAYAIGHDVTTESFARALSNDGFDSDVEAFADFEHIWITIADHRQDCDEDGCYCDEFQWWCVDTAKAPGADRIAVTWWSA